MSQTPGAAIHDESKNFRMSALQERDEELCLAFSERKKSHFCNSFFVSKLLDKGNIKLIPTIITEVDENIDIFALERIYIPINIGNSHWDVAILDMQTFKSRNMDSMGPSSKERLHHEAQTGCLTTTRRRSVVVLLMILSIHSNS